MKLGNVMIENSVITIGSQKVGTANQDFRFGYHPSIRVTVGEAETWFELDASDLLAKVANFARDNTL